MSAEEYLSEVRNEWAEIRQLEERLEDAQSRMFPGAIRYDAVRVQTSPENKMEETYSKVDMCERKLRDKLQQLLERYDTAMDYVNRLEKSEHRQVLRLYYLSQYRDDKGRIAMPTWETVAKKMMYSDRMVYVFHRDALNELEKIWDI